MKVIKREETHCSFLIGKREREMLFSLLQRYPAIGSAHFRNRNTPKDDDAKKNQELIEEALAEQQKESRKQLEQMLAEPGRFTENEFGYTFKLSHSEIEWMLQMLNDVRVGSWIQLGEPNPNSANSPNSADSPDRPPLNEQTVMLYWSMEIAGLFQQSLLDSTKPAES